jgi:hypothetical protein
MRSPYFTTRWFGLAVFTSIAISILLAVLFKSRSYDDPYITYRYADNLRRGFGFVYNPGEYIQSTTTPLFTLLLAVLYPLWGNLPRLANLIGVLSLAVGGLLLWDIAASWKTPWAGWVGLCLYPIFPLAITPLGSETPLYIALCLGAFAAYARRHYKLTAVCAALATLTRPDGLLVGLILAGDFVLHLYRQKKSRHLAVDDQPATSIPWKAVIVFLLILLPWFIFAWVYFGSPLPATLAAKQQQGAMAVSQRFAQGFLTTLGWYKSWQYELEAGLALLGLVFSFWRARQWLLFLAWPVFYFAAFSILGVSRYFWYYTPLVPGFLAFSGLGLQAIAGFRLNRSPGQQNSLHWKKYFPVLNHHLLNLHIQPMQILALVSLTALCLAQASGLPRLRQPATRYAIYRAAGVWLAAHTAADAVVGTLEVGILGYYARRPMVDFAGLIQPKVAAQLAAGADYENAALWAVEHYQPQYLVLFSGDFPRLEQGYVAHRCRLGKSFAGQKYGFEKDLAVFDCR